MDIYGYHIYIDHIFSLWTIYMFIDFHLQMLDSTNLQEKDGILYCKVTCLLTQ